MNIQLELMKWMCLEQNIKSACNENKTECMQTHFFNVVHVYPEANVVCLKTHDSLF